MRYGNLTSWDDELINLEVKFDGAESMVYTETGTLFQPRHSEDGGKPVVRKRIT